MPPAGAPRYHVLHAIHDFLPRHRAGAEIYVHDLCRALAAHADVTVVCAEYDPAGTHGDLRWRTHEGVRVAEIVNNWIAPSFEDTYRSPVITRQLARVLDDVGPDVLHVHSLFNLSFDLPQLARNRGVPVAATLHDYTWLCASGGQRVHRAEAHACDVIETTRCARCWQDSPWSRQVALAALAPRPGAMREAAQAVRRAMPRVADAIATVVHGAAAPAVSDVDLSARLQRGREALQALDLVVAPSASIAAEYRRLGAPTAHVSVSDYGFTGAPTPAARPPSGPLRLGFVGTPVWHKGLHVVIDALRRLEGEPVTLAVHGDTNVDPAYAATLRKAARGLPVTWAGGFGRAAVAAVYDSIDVLVVPSIWPENSPLVIHEAFMAGVAVVASRIGGIPELLRDGWNGWLFEPGDAVALADLLRCLAHDTGQVAEAVRHAPAVKGIADDAAAWDARYRSLLAARDVAS